MGEEGQKYQLTKEGGETTNNSSGYTGKGVAVYANGEQYDGEFVNGERHGKGKYTWPLGENSNRYEGEFKNNQKNGIGRMFYFEKGEYFGYFLNDQRHGEGMFTYHNKDIYSGLWANGKKHGKGTYVYNSTNCRYIGQWSENQLIKGRWVFPDGKYYEGEFQNNQPSGKGVWKFANGNEVTGTYKQEIVPSVSGSGSINVSLDWKSLGEVQNSLVQ